MCCQYVHVGRRTPARSAMIAAWLTRFCFPAAESRASGPPACSGSRFRDRKADRERREREQEQSQAELQPRPLRAPRAGRIVWHGQRCCFAGTRNCNHVLFIAKSRKDENAKGQAGARSLV